MKWGFRVGQLFTASVNNCEIQIEVCSLRCSAKCVKRYLEIPRWNISKNKGAQNWPTLSVYGSLNFFRRNEITSSLAQRQPYSFVSISSSAIVWGMLDTICLCSLFLAQNFFLFRPWLFFPLWSYMKRNSIIHTFCYGGILFFEGAELFLRNEKEPPKWFTKEDHNITTWKALLLLRSSVVLVISSFYRFSHIFLHERWPQEWNFFAPLAIVF